MRELLTSLPAALAFLTGPDLVIEFANDACFRLVGGRNLLGRPLMEVLPELADQEEILVQVMNSGEPVRGSEAGIRFGPDEQVSRRGESHPPPLSGPDVTVSRHPAPTVRPAVNATGCQ